MKTNNMGSKMMAVLVCSGAVCLAGSAGAAVINVTTSNFANKMNEVSSGDTVNFANGTYTFTSTLFSKLAKANVKIIGESKSGVQFYSNVSNIDERFFFDSKNGVQIEKVTFFNTSVRFKDSSNFVVKNCKFDNNKNLASSSIPEKICRASGGSGGTFENLQAVHNSPSWFANNWKAFVMVGHSDGKITDTTSEGKLAGGIGIGSTTGGNMTGNTSERYSGGPENGRLECDHGIYVNTHTGFTVNGNTMTGWPDKACGQGLKLKEVEDGVARYNHFYTSGLIVRSASTANAIKNVYMQSNTCHAGDLSFWLVGKKAVAVRVKSCAVKNGIITLTDGDYSQFNNTVGAAGNLAGGFYGCSATGFTAPSNVINNNFTEL